MRTVTSRKNCPARSKGISAYADSSAEAEPRQGLLKQAVEGVLQWLSPVLKYSEIIKRFIVTVLMLCIIRSGHFIPLPGVDMQQVGSPQGRRPRSLRQQSCTW